jgi:2,4-dienoyl-CoA reductase-like NADH-dependent reductase (Old Yellow Enzyme family)
VSALFSTFKLKGVTLRNRIVVPPMCQYSAVDGVVNEWHLSHLSQLARGGAGLVIVEALREAGSTSRTATSHRVSSLRTLTVEMTFTAAAQRIAAVSCWKLSQQSGKCGPKPCH